MNCPACAHANRPGAKFCEECAAPLPRGCASCGAELRATAKFCDECGAPVGAGAPAGPRAGAGASEARGEAEPSKSSEAQRGSAGSGARKVVTIIFADLVGSTALHERLDPESVRRFMESYYAAMRGAVDAHGGRVTQVMGDGVKAVFGAPRVAEDDALRAVRAGVEMQRVFRELAEREARLVGQTGLRVAVNTGEVVADDASEIIGDPVNVAARLQEKGAVGDVVIGGETQRIVAAHVTLALLGSFALKGRSEPVKAYRVESLEPPARETTAAFVGREAELARLRSAYEMALAKPATQLAVLLGSPGLGKSRLIDEFARRIGDATRVMSAHCDAAGAATFAPLARALRLGLGIEAAASGDALRAALAAVLPGEDAESARIAKGIAALLGGSPAPPEETFFVVRRLLGALAAQQPVLLVIDDLHWAEPLLLDLVEHLVQWGSGTRLLVLVGARPELRDARSSLATPGGLVSEVITLAGLDAGAATRLAANVIGAADLPAAIAAKLLITSEGNPLFVGELVRMLVEEGALRREGERWVASAELAALEMPPTIHALLAARIERLRPEERGVLERAAVVGRHFSRSAVAALLGPREAAELDARLEALRRGELIERDTGWWLGEPALRFHHVLIRDAAYRRVLKGTRAELHGRLADWIEARAGESTEHDETIGWHLEQAHEHLRELGPLDARAVLLGTRAAQRLAAAGRRALARDDLSLATSLLRRALGLLDPADAARADLALDCSEALLASGEVGPAAEVIEELGRLVGDSERLRAWHTCFAGQLTALTEPSALNASATSVAAAAAALAKLGDAAGEAKAHHVHAQALARLGRVGAAEAALDRALAAARRPGGDRRRANAVLAGAPLAALWGPSPVTRASGRCLDVVRVLRITQDAPAVEAVALSCQGVLEALRGRTDAARRMVAAARKMVEELGVTQRVLEVDGFAARIDLLEGHAPAAERVLRGAYDGLRALGLGIDAARAAALLGRALLAQGRAADAEALSHESEALAGDDLQAAIAWRGVRAGALAQRGEHAAAVALAQAAVEIAAATDALLDHADARLALAAALRAVGRNNEADAEERRAIELWEAKGATLLAERARTATQHQASLPLRRAAPAPLPASPSLIRGIQRGTAASALARLDAAFAAGDEPALEGTLGETYDELDHATGTRIDRAAACSALRLLLELRDPSLRHEPLATLGESLVLCWRWIRGSGMDREGWDVAEFGDKSIVVAYASTPQQLQAVEVFPERRLGDAVARLYERYAELLPEGPARDRAAATARSVTTLVETFDLARFAAAVDPNIEIADARSVGTGPLHGADAVLRSMRALLDLSEAGVEWRIDDVFGASPGALCIRHTSFGRERLGGGAFERNLDEVWVFGPDGLITRWERFDLEHEAEALARFDALTAAAQPARAPARRMRENAATRNIERFSAALAARDAAALALTLDESLHVVHHPTRATYGRREMLGTWRSGMRAAQFEFRQENLAALGDSLLLERHFVSVEGLADANLEAFGRSEFHELALFDVAGSGRAVHVEIFAAEELSHAVCRLYERYAESLPAGAERTQAEVIARSASVMLGQPDLAATAAVLAPAVEFTDLRTVGFGTLRGAATVVDTIAAMMKLSSGDAAHVDDVLALEADALVVRWTNTGTDRATGGVFERKLCQLFTFGEDGLVTRWQQFEAEHSADALARFDELTARGAPQQLEHFFVNAAARTVDAFDRCFNARDWPGVEALHAPEVFFDDQRRMLRNTSGKQGALATLRFLFDVPSSRFASTLLATRGERLALHRMEFAGEVAGGGGPLAVDPSLALREVDRDGRTTAIVLFDATDEAAAYAELGARFEAGEGAGQPAVNAWRAFRGVYASRDWEAISRSLAAGFALHDHRPLGFGDAVNATRWVDLQKALADLSPDATVRVDHMRTGARGFLWQAAWQGTRDGGAFETPYFAVFEVDALGSVQRLHTFALDQFPAALARFEEVRAASAQAEEPFANAAARSVESETRAFAARDWEAVVALISPAVRFHDRRRMMYAETSYEGHLAQYRLLFDQPTSRWRQPLLATRGERLSLHRVSYEADVAGGGGPLAFDDFLCVVEIDVDGRWIAVVNFDLGAEDAAYAELEARWDAQLQDSRERESAAAKSRHFRLINGRDWDAFQASCAPEVVRRDHRRLGMPPSRGPRAVVDALRAMAELAPDVLLHLDHRRCAGRGELWQMCWRGTRDGGAFEIPMLGVSELDEHDRMLCLDLYDLEDWGQARARFDEIAARTASAADASPSRFENAASRAWRTVIAAWDARDVPRFAQLHHALARMRDQRRLVQLDLDREQFLEFSRPLLEMRLARTSLELLATRGERMALMRHTMEMADENVGPSAIDSVMLIETNTAGAIAEYQRWDVDDLDAAYAELDARFAAGKAAWMPAFCRAVTRRDWAAMSDLIAEGVVADDHRLVSWGTLRGLAAYVPVLRSMVELAPNVRLRLDHLMTRAGGELFQATWIGTRDGGAFEIPVTGVSELNESGQQIRLDLYDPEHLDQARARFAEISARTAAPPSARFENAATRACAALVAFFSQRDWQRLGGLLAAGLRYSDRRRLVQLELGRDQYLAFVRQIGDMPSSHFELEPFATRGDRLALARSWNEVAGGDVGPSQIESLLLLEMNERNEIAGFVRFDSDDLGSAIAELDARWEDGEASVHPRTALVVRAYRRSHARHAWEEVEAQVSPLLTFEDHRPLALGILGRERWIASLRALSTLAEDLRWQVDHLRTSEGGFMIVGGWRGTRDGGAFEIPFWTVFALGAAGKIERIDVFPPEQLGAALARFDGLGASAARDPLRIPPNAATRALERWFAAAEAGDFEAIEALHSPAYRGEDRRRMLRTPFDRAAQAGNARFLFERGFRGKYTLLATAGDRLAMQHIVWTSEAAEIGLVEVCEVDPEGRYVWNILFDPDARAAASAELFERYVASGADGMAASAIEFIRAFNTRDLGRLRAAVPGDFVFHDRRRTGFGRLEGVDAYIASVAALGELSRDVRLDELYYAAIAPHGRVAIARMSGTNSEGGEFESYMTRLTLYRAERFVQAEMLELEELDATLARFEELGASAVALDPLRIPPSAATRFEALWAQSFAAADWNAQRALASADFRYEDRTRRALVSGDVETWFRSAQYLRSEAGARIETRVLGTLGERIAIHSAVIRAARSGDEFELARVRLTELDVEGKIRAFMLFDPEDRAAAFAEAQARFAVGEAGASGGQAPIARLVSALGRHDWEALRGALAPDAAIRDRRALAVMGAYDREQWIQSLRTLADLAPDWDWELFRILTWNRHGRVAAGHVFGNVRDGGPFENVFVAVLLTRGEHVERYEFFDAADTERALARFEELSASAAARDPLHIPPNAATRIEALRAQAFAAEDWDAHRAFASADFRFEDRTKRALVSGDVETWIRSSQYLRSEVGASIERRLLGTLGERIAVYSFVVRGTRSGDDFEIEGVRLIELDAAGKLRAFMRFDAEDRVAAFLEAGDRFAAGEAAGVGGQAAIATLSRAIADQDWLVLRACLTDGFETHDLRTLGLGLLARDAWVDSVRALAGLGSHVHLEHLRLLAWNRHGLVDVARMSGLNESGGPFEILSIGVTITEGDRVARIERYDLADTERALARFEALCAEREQAERLGAGGRSQARER